MNKIGRNDPCPCGSGRKYKQCCLPRGGVQATAIAAPPASDQAQAGVHANLGNLLNDQGRLDEAVDAYRRALAIKPDFAEVHSNLGVTLHAQGKFDLAITSHRQSLSLKPDYAAAHFNLGLSLQALARHEEAAESYRNTLALMPDYAQAHSNLGAALEAQGRRDEAVASYRKALELSPSLLAARHGLVSVLTATVPLWHVPMMNDQKRNDAYYAALRAAVTPDSNVFEIGTGAGLLSMMAATLGAKTVTTCEAEPLIAAAAQRIIADNALDRRINLVARKSTDIAIGADMAERADILVSEIFSSELLGERVLPSIEDAKNRLLKPDCRIIPAAGSIMIALFGGADIGGNLVVEESCGFDVRHFNSIVPGRQIIHRSDLHVEMLSEDAEAFRFDFEHDGFTPGESKTLRIPVRGAGRCYGIIQWIRLQMDQDIVFQNHPLEAARASGWQHFAYVFPQPVTLREGQVAVVSAAHNRVFPWFALERVE